MRPEPSMAPMTCWCGFVSGFFGWVGGGEREGGAFVFFVALVGSEKHKEKEERSALKNFELNLA